MTLNKEGVCRYVIPTTYKVELHIIGMIPSSPPSVPSHPEISTAIGFTVSPNCTTSLSWQGRIQSRSHPMLCCCRRSVEFLCSADMLVLTNVRKRLRASSLCL